jgi:hypothetical protein
MNVRRLATVALGASLALPLGFAVAPASADPPVDSEVCGWGYVGDTSLPLPACQECPPGVSAGPTGVRPLVLVYVCTNP